MGKKSKDKAKKETKGGSVTANVSSVAVLQEVKGTGVKTKVDDRSSGAGDFLRRDTFSWDKNLVFPKLPPLGHLGQPPRSVTFTSRRKPDPLMVNGWDFYCSARPGVEKLLMETHVKEGLSYALTVAHVYSIVRTDQEEKMTNLVLIGASRCEERIARETEYWEEIAHAFPAQRFKLWLVGEEVTNTSTRSRRKIKNTKVGMEIHFHRGKVLDFFYNNEHFLRFQAEEWIVLGMFCGFAKEHMEAFTHSEKEPLKTTTMTKKTTSTTHPLPTTWSWLPDMSFLAGAGIKICFIEQDMEDLPAMVRVMSVAGLNVKSHEVIHCPFPARDEKTARTPCVLVSGYDPEAMMWSGFDYRDRDSRLKSFIDANKCSQGRKDANQKTQSTSVTETPALFSNHRGDHVPIVAQQKGNEQVAKTTQPGTAAVKEVTLRWKCSKLKKSKERLTVRVEVSGTRLLLCVSICLSHCKGHDFSALSLQQTPIWM
ncbi:unnamed protein product [Discosporangium mesarthrocarpum]